MTYDNPARAICDLQAPLPQAYMALGLGACKLRIALTGM